MTHPVNQLSRTVISAYRKYTRSKTFLLGVGCQKGGTTWLHRHLCANPCVQMGFAKEYHILDTHYLPGSRHILDKRVQRLTEALEHRTLFEKGRFPHLLKTVDFHKNISNYYRYFDALHGSSKRIRVVGDITPSYGGLPAEAFSEVRQMLEQRGFKVKVIFLMRDPLERVWSQIRMKRRDMLIRHPNHVFRFSEEEELLRFHAKGGIETRTRYEKTIANLEAAFDPSDILYEFYESLYTERAVDRIADFLGIPYQEPEFERRVNVSEKKNPIAETTARTVVGHYRRTYEFCDRRFPEADIRNLWSGARYL